jgi:hypothetical protein
MKTEDKVLIALTTVLIFSFIITFLLVEYMHRNPDCYIDGGMYSDAWDIACMLRGG